MTPDAVTASVLATRMTCFNPDVTGATSAPVAVTFDGSKGARALSDRPAELESRAAALGLGWVLTAPAGTEAEALAGLVADGMRARGGVPGVVSLGGTGLMGVHEQAGTARRAVAALVQGSDRLEPVPPRPGRLAGKVAMITGAAQGFGRGIAEGLVREGACALVSDIQEEAGQACARELAQIGGEGSAEFCRVDVTDRSSVEDGVRRAVCAFGGIDLFVANAGVLKAGDLEGMDERAFDFVTNVNYKGYFLCAKAVAPAMKLQHKFHPQHFMDIVQINSKSGLVGSERNFAYAGSKFGTIGLTQSFALELLPWNIKVNSVCPGNYFDGPLWSDPENGLFAQYFRVGKVKGAKTVEDVRRYYEGKVPMNRGCTPQDVVTGILYLHEQTYETGQALAVTGGQIMLS